MTHAKLIKVTRAKVVNGDIRLAKVLRNWKIEPNQISAIKLERVLSLVDEIGIFLDAGPVFFLTDATSGFKEVADLLRFDELFGKDWYQRAENGETLRWEKTAR